MIPVQRLKIQTDRFAAVQGPCRDDLWRNHGREAFKFVFKLLVGVQQIWKQECVAEATCVASQHDPNNPCPLGFHMKRLGASSQGLQEADFIWSGTGEFG